MYPDPGRWGIQREFTDTNGARQSASESTVAAVLDAMGAGTDVPPDATAVVIESGDPLPHDVVHLRLEDGTESPIDREGRDLPFGYHTITDRGGVERSLIVSPGKCWLPDELKLWGWAVQLYAARSLRSWGIGDLHDLGSVARWAKGHGANVLLLNPFHAVNPGPQQASPYFPSSRRLKNPLYIAVEAVPGATTHPDFDDVVAAGRALNETETIDRDAIFELKMEVLRRVWETARSEPSFTAFCARQGSGLEDAATYMALAEHFGAGHPTWPEGYEHPRNPAVTEWRRANGDRIAFHMWLQWILDKQLEEVSQDIGLIHDLAIGVDSGGADAWMWQDVFADGVTVGAPPDQFSASGQDWGLPPFDPWKLRAAGYEPFIQTIRSCLSHGVGLRIDHVMGLFRLWWVPKGVSAAEGVYVRYPHDDLLGIVALESQRAGALIIGEDLGTVEVGVREEMAERNLLSYRVMWFEDDEPSDYPELALAAVTNHDLPPVAGVWTEADVEEHRELGIETDEQAARDLRDRLEADLGLATDAESEEVIEAVHHWIATSPSAVVIATLEDALAVERRPNIPGTSDEERSNWSVPLPHPVDRLHEHELANRVARAISSRRAQGTGPEPL